MERRTVQVIAVSNPVHLFRWLCTVFLQIRNNVSGIRNDTHARAHTHTHTHTPTRARAHPHSSTHTQISRKFSITDFSSYCYYKQTARPATGGALQHVCTNKTIANWLTARVCWPYLGSSQPFVVPGTLTCRPLYMLNLKSVGSHPRCPPPQRALSGLPAAAPC